MENLYFLRTFLGLAISTLDRQEWLLSWPPASSTLLPLTPLLLLIPVAHSLPALHQQQPGLASHQYKAD